MEEILASIRRIISDDVAAETVAQPVQAIAAPEASVEPEPVAEPEANEAVEPVAAEEIPLARPVIERAAVGAEPRSFARPLAASAPRPAASFAPAAPRRPFGEPIVARGASPVRAAAAPAVAETVVEQAPASAENDDLDAPFAAALLDLALVEKAVQAELAAVPLEAFTEAALVDHDEPADEPAPMAEEPVVPLTVAVASAPESRRAETSAGSVTTDPAPARTAPTQTAPEAVDMQVQAKPAPLSSRPAAAAPAAPAVQAPRAPEAATLPEPARLVSSPTNTAVAASFGALARTVASNSRSVEDVVTEAIRPMLKSWLDENLPALVERLVRAEIERVARQG